MSKATSWYIRELNPITDAYLKVIMKHVGKPDDPWESLTKEDMDGIYREITVKQKKGKKIKVRKTYTPSLPELKKLHQVIIDSTDPVREPIVKSYERGDSVVQIAKLYEGYACIGGLDIKDFFPSINIYMAEMAFARLLGIAAPDADTEPELTLLARKLARVCTKSNPVNPGSALGSVPLGIPPAPRISNAILYNIDRKLMDMADTEGVLVTRYSDNIFMGIPRASERYLPEDRKNLMARMEALLKKAAAIIESEEYPAGPGSIFSFTVNKDKTHIMPYWKQQRVLGVVVNEHANPPVISKEFIRSSFTHLSRDTIGFVEKLEGMSVREIVDSKDELRRELSRLARRYKRNDGYLNWFTSINPVQREKFSTPRNICNAMITEASNMILGSVKKGGTE